MPTVLDWSPTVDPAEVVGPVRDVLAAGQVVVLPGDVGYVALANPAAAGGLNGLAGEWPNVLAWGPDDAAAFGLAVPAVARRLMTRAWPAPLAIELPADGAVFSPDWPAAVRDEFTSRGALRFRCPDHPVFDAVIPALAGPVLAADTLLPTAEAAIERSGDAVGLVVAAGAARWGGNPTVVRVHDREWRVTEPGAFPAEEVEKLAARIVLFVCTGNTCRSPLAEALAKKLLADRLGCGVAELPGRGFWVLSAGVATYGGSPAAAESIAVAAEFGADLENHRSRPMNPPLLAAADDVIVMTRGHAQSLAAQFPGVGPPARLLCGDDDLDDPIGAGPGVYQACARTIYQNLERFIPEWVRP